MRSAFFDKIKKMAGDDAVEIIYRLFSFVPDEPYLKFLYRVRTGKKLNLESPVSINDKIQWLKLHDRKPVYTKMVDKIASKEFVAERIGEKHIIRTLGCWKSFKEIDFDSLPDQFVLKCNHDSGGLVIVKDKSRLDMKKAEKIISRSLRRNFYKNSREWPYKGIKPMVFAEEFLDGGENGLTDYKFFCFDGDPKFINVSRFEHTDDEEISFYSLDWELTPFQRTDHKRLSVVPPRPRHLEEMTELARRLSKGVPFLRVDLYEYDDRVYFGEPTLYPTAGLAQYGPEGWSETLGSWIPLPKKNN